MKTMPSPMNRERNQLPLMPVTASASLYEGRVMHFDLEGPHSSYWPAERSAYVAAATRGTDYRRRAIRQGGQPLTASGSGFTIEEDETYAVWQASLILQDLQATDLLNQLEA